MAITLSRLGVAVDLPDDLFWLDEHTWSPVMQTVATSVTGAVIIDTAAKLAEKPITLVGDEAHAWIPFSAVQQLKAWALIPGCEMTLNIRGTAYTVIFRHHDAPAIDLTPIVDFAIPDAQDWFSGQLKFMGI